MSDIAKVRFWGVRGSIPAPIGNGYLHRKVAGLIGEFAKTGGKDVDAFLKSRAPLTYGGNTSCVQLTYKGHIYVLDMGTGLRELGNSLFADMLKNKGLGVTFVISHVHWDHVQGLPFFGPLYVNKQSGIKNRWHFIGGTCWQKTAEECMRGQMDPPTFPVSWQEIQKITSAIEFSDIFDLMTTEFKDRGVAIKFGKLNHPQETYGSRFTFDSGATLAYTTDNEPYDPAVPDPRLERLVSGVDLWITDCQYTKAQFDGKVGGVPRHGWGHSYPEAVAATCVKAGVRKVVLFHHDPAADDEKVAAIRDETRALIAALGGTTEVDAAYEGLEYELAGALVGSAR